MAAGSSAATHAAPDSPGVTPGTAADTWVLPYNDPAALERARMSREQLRAALTYTLLREAVQDARYPELAVGDARLRRFYERNREKLFTRPPSVELAALAARNEGIAGNALERLRQGRPFEEVARQFSVDPQLKDSGGRLGWVYTRSMPAALRRAIDAVPVGELSPKPVQAMGGWYVFKVLGRRPAKVMSLAQVRDELSKELTRRERSAALEQWLKQTRDEAQIDRS